MGLGCSWVKEQLWPDGTMNSLGESVWASGRGRAGDMLVPPPSTRMARHSTQEDKQMYRVMLVCGWLQPTTASLPFLLAVEYEEGADSHSLLFLE